MPDASECEYWSPFLKCHLILLFFLPFLHSVLKMTLLFLSQFWLNQGPDTRDQSKRLETGRLEIMAFRMRYQRLAYTLLRKSKLCSFMCRCNSQIMVPYCPPVFTAYDNIFVLSTDCECRVYFLCTDLTSKYLSLHKAHNNNMTTVTFTGNYCTLHSCFNTITTCVIT